MLTLFKRELEETIVYFVGALVFATIFISILASVFYLNEYDKAPFVVFGLVLWVLWMLMGCAMGATQMYWDRRHRVSELLSTLTTTRRQILTAKIAAGVAAILTTLVPVGTAVVILVQVYGVYGVPIPIRNGLYLEIALPMFLLALMCYSVGLASGWTSSKVAPTLGGLGISALMLTVILIKGLGVEMYVVILLFIAVSLTRAWWKFTSRAM